MKEELPGALGFQEELTIGGGLFQLVTSQRDGESAVYRSEDGSRYLRIGKTERIRKDLELHKQMEAAGFPVATLVGEGETGGKHYFIESSLGEGRLGDLFGDDVSRDGAIAEEHFSKFLSVVERFGRAQLTTVVPPDFDEFARGIHLDWLSAELPEYEKAIGKRFQEAVERLSIFPFVLTHGDFNPMNLYSEGVIDLEDSFRGPFGYDIMTALVHIGYFPDSAEYEYFSRYRFTPKQADRYRAMADTLSQQAGFPPLSRFEADFDFCRGAWSLVRMHKWPKLQEFRYNLFIKKFLS